MSKNAVASSSAAPPPVSVSEAEIDKLLSREATAFQREIEVERILKAFKLNPYDILDLQPGATPDEIKKKFRQISLFIHPDKCSHENAPEAFDRLKKAESELSDQNKREQLDAVINQARIHLLKSLSLPTTISDDDPRLAEVGWPIDAWKARIRQESRDMFIDEEVRRRRAIKLNLANEGLEAQKKEEEVNQRKRKVENDRKWEDDRDQRVDSWRSFNNTKKKKKAKISVLG